MKDFILSIWNKLMAAFEVGDNGFSARKLSAFAIILCCVSAHVKWIALGDFEQLEMVLTIDYAFIGALFGMTTYQNIKSNKNEARQYNNNTDNSGTN